MEKSKKVIGEYKVTFKTIPTEQMVNFEIILNEPLQELLKGFACISEKPVAYSIRVGNDDRGNTIIKEYQRYLMNRVAYSSLTNSYREMLTNKTLIDTGKIVIEFSDIRELKRLQELFKMNLKQLVEFAQDFKTEILEVTFKPQKED